MTFQPSGHHRRSIRLKGYDYTRPGAYFVTLVAFRREQIFGEIRDGQVCLSRLGEIVREEWLRSTQMRKEIELFEDEFIIMPNHMHGIVHIVEIARGADGGRPKDVQVQAVRLHRAPRSLGSFIAGFKSSVTSRAKKELKMAGIWQRNYYEHIIRVDAELEDIWIYIEANPSRWEDDRFHPSG